MTSQTGKKGDPQKPGAAVPDSPISPPGKVTIDDPWAELRAFTPARIALGRSGASMPTRQVLDLSVAHAMAQDAIHLPFDVDGIQTRLSAAGLDHVRVCSRVGDRRTYLLRPDLGRRLDEAGADRLRSVAETRPAPDIVFVIGDGLSPLAGNTYATELLEAVLPQISPERKVGPIVIAEQARVALGDEVAEIFGAKIIAVLIGERPGLSSRDSLGVYITHNARIGTPDSARNCLSNIRAEGLAIPAAAAKLAWFVQTALFRGVTGIGLKDESGDVQSRQIDQGLTPE